MIVHASRFSDTRAGKVMRGASSKLFSCRNVNSKCAFVKQTFKSINFSRGESAAACFQTTICLVTTTTAVREPIMNYRTRGQRKRLSSTIVKNMNKLKLN